MGIVIGSCMSKETSAANINSPVYPPGRHSNNIGSSDGRESLRMLMSGGGVSYVSAEHQQQQQQQRRALSGPVPYAYIHDSSSHPLRGHHIPRRVVHGEWARGLRFPLSSSPFIRFSDLLAPTLGIAFSHLLVYYSPVGTGNVAWRESKQPHLTILFIFPVCGVFSCYHLIHRHQMSSLLQVCDARRHRVPPRHVSDQTQIKLQRY